MDVTNKVAIITGSAKGLGKAFAEALLQRGARVCLCDIDSNLLQTTYEEFASRYGKSNVCSLPCDVTVEGDLKDVFSKTLQEFEGLDIMVNNAGIANENAWDKMIDINLKGMVRGTLLAIDTMKQENGGKKGGIIINVASLAGLLPVPHAPAYSATKHGVVAYTKSWAKHPDITSNSIRMVCLCPGYANTDIIKFTDETVNGIDMANESMEKIGILNVDTVVEAFLKLLDDDDNHGKALSLVKSREMAYH